MNLGTSIVSEYETRFTAVSRFVSEMVSMRNLKYKRFQKGLHTIIRPHVVVLRHTNYGKLVAATLSSKKEKIDTG